jgi:hypothetical protein
MWKVPAELRWLSPESWELPRVGGFAFLLKIHEIAKILVRQRFGMKPLVFQGHRYLRQRLLLSILSGRPVKIEKIRSDSSEPGLKGDSSWY